MKAGNIWIQVMRDLLKFQGLIPSFIESLTKSRWMMKKKDYFGNLIDIFIHYIYILFKLFFFNGIFSFYNVFKLLIIFKIDFQSKDFKYYLFNFKL